MLREALVERVPGHFGMVHLISAWLGSLFFGFTFVLKGLLLEVGLQLSTLHLVLITITTWAILSAEIFFVGYARVRDRSNRKFGQFWAKRIVGYYLIAVFTSFLLLSVYGLTEIAGGPYNSLKLIIAVSFPAAIGAAAGDLMGKYR